MSELANDSAVLKDELGKWQGIHPFLSNFDGMVTAQYFSGILEENSKKTIAAQLESADKIVASADYNAKEIRKNFSDSIESLNSTFEWGFTEIIWKLGQQQKTLQKIIATLQKPLETKSIELRNRGIDAYKNGWYDDAIKDLLQAKEDNRYDFTIHQTLGNIFLFHKYNPEKSIESYQNAAKYSEPYSKKFASFAYLHLGLVYYFIHDYQNAYNSTLKAITLSPDSSLCYYEHARYCAKLNKTDEAIENLKKIVYQEPFYCAKVNSEPDFHPIMNEIEDLFKDVYHHLELISQKRLKSAKELLDHAKILGIPSEQLESFSDLLKNAEYSYSKSSILDFQYSIIKSESTITNLLTHNPQ